MLSPNLGGGPRPDEGETLKIQLGYWVSQCYTYPSYPMQLKKKRTLIHLHIYLHIVGYFKN